MLKFKTLCAVLVNLSSNLLNEVGLSLFRYFEVSLRVCDIVVNKFTFAISSPDEFLLETGTDEHVFKTPRFLVFSERQLRYVRYMPSQYRLSAVCRLPVTLVRPTQAVALFGNFFHYTIAQGL